ncbi:MAG: hypothetical protein NTZ69_18040 [Bacteroidia bacterium]|nr:hypothetical protein [Bacteroidia bacterium]
MNFIKRTGIVLMVFTIIASSCNKHSDDFVPNNSNTPDIQVAGVTALVTNISTLKSTISSIQTTIVALPETSSIATLKASLTVIAGRIDTITSILNKLSMSDATKTIIEGLKTNLKALPAKVVTDVNALKVQIAVIGTSSDIQAVQVARLNTLITASTALTGKIDFIQKSLDNLTNFQGFNATQVAVDALVIQMAAAQFSFDVLLATYMP